MPPENVRKNLVFGRFQEVYKWNIGVKLVERIDSKTFTFRTKKSKTERNLSKILTAALPGTY